MQSLRFSPVDAAGRTAAGSYRATPAARQMMAASGRTPALSSAAMAADMPSAQANGTSASTFASAASSSAAANGQSPTPRAESSSVAPPMAAPYIVGQFSYRMEAPFRAQVDAVIAEAQAESRPARMRFPVADGRTVDLVITGHDAQDTTQGVLYARVDNQPFAQVVLAYVNEAVAGTIATPDGETFIVRYAGGGVHRTLQLDPNQMVDGEPLAPEPGRHHRACESRRGAARVVRGGAAW